MIQLDDKALKDIMVSAVLQTIDSGKRDAILKGAIESLMTPSEKSYYTGRAITPLESAFNEAIKSVAAAVARETLEKDETVRAAIRDKIVAGYEKMMSDGSSKMVDSIADAIAGAFKGERY